MAAPLNTCTTIEQRGVVRFLWAKNMDAAKDINKETLPKGRFSISVGSIFKSQSIQGKWYIFSCV
jgi:hypothetical protein